MRRKQIILTNRTKKLMGIKEEILDYNDIEGELERIRKELVKVWHLMLNSESALKKQLEQLRILQGKHGIFDPETDNMIRKSVPDALQDFMDSVGSMYEAIESKHDEYKD